MVRPCVGPSLILTQLRARLNQTYHLRIVARPGEDTGVFRIPDVNSAARNYYIVVEAVDAGGNALSVPITSEEDGFGTHRHQMGGARS